MKTWEELSRSVIRKWDCIGVKLCNTSFCFLSILVVHLLHHSLWGAIKPRLLKAPALNHWSFCFEPKKSADTNFSAILASTQWKSSQIELAPMGLLCWKCWRLRWTLISGGSSGRAPSLHQYVKVALSFAESQMWLQISGCHIGVWFLGWNIWL